MIAITPSAKGHILKTLKELDLQILFFGLQGGGCAGFEYFWKPMSEEEYPFHGSDDDQVLDLGDDRKIIVDSTSAQMITGSIIDFKKAFIGGQLVVDNPNAKGGCGCGSSVNI